MRNKFRVGIICLLAFTCLGPSTQAAEVEVTDFATNAASYHSAAPWSEKPGTTEWTEKALVTIRSRITDFERARDKNDFCPGYASASKRNQEICWLRLIGAVVQFESNFQTDAMFKEANGNYSVGLLMLSTNECEEAPTKSDLKIAQRNLECGIEKMAYLIDHDGFIDGPNSSRGAAAYWSTLRDPYHSGHLKLGRRPAIEAITKKYKLY